MDLTSPIIVGLLLTHVQQWLKRQSWFPLIQEQGTKRLNVAFTGMASALAALGITYGYDASQGVLVIGGLTPDSLMTYGWTWLVTWLTAQTAYKGGLAGAAPLPIQVSTTPDSAVIAQATHAVLARALEQAAAQLRDP